MSTKVSSHGAEHLDGGLLINLNEAVRRVFFFFYVTKKVVSSLSTHLPKNGASKRTFSSGWIVRKHLRRELPFLWAL